MDLFNLQAKIGINTKEFSAGIATAGKEFSEIGSKIKSGAETLAKVGVAAFTAVTGAATATTAALIKGVDAYTTYGDTVDKMSQKLNMSAQAYQEWSAIMEHSGTSIDSMQASMKTLANAVETGNDAFERLGISQEEIAALNNEQLFSKTITALQNVGNETERTYLAGQLLGRGATELGALLNTSAEDTEKMRQRVHELGGVMSNEAVKASAKYKDSIQDMKTAFVGMGRGLISDFVPALTQVSDGLTAIFSGDEKGAEMFMKGFDDAIANLGNSAAKIKPIVKKLGSIAAKVAPEIIKTVGTSMIEAIPNLLESGKGILERVADGMRNVKLDGSGILGNLLDSIVNNIPEYLDYASSILSNLANAFLDIDFAKVAQSLSTVLKSAINSITDFFANVDMEKVGRNIADFVSNIDWKGIAESVINLLGTAIGSLDNIAKGFFENMDGETFMNALAVLAAPKLLGGMLTSFKGTECASQWTSIQKFMGSEIGKGGNEAGVSFMTAFQAGALAFIAGWEVGTAIKNSLDSTFGKENVDDVLGRGTIDVLTLGMNEMYNEQPKSQKAREEAANTFTYMGSDGHEHQAFKHGKDGKDSAIYNREFARHNIKGMFDDYGEIPKYGNGGRVTRPTIAIVGEKEPETIVPDSKRGEFGMTNYNTFNINIDGTGKNAEELADEVIEAFSTKFALLEIQQQRAVGGRGW